MQPTASDQPGWGVLNGDEEDPAGISSLFVEVCEHGGSILSVNVITERFDGTTVEAGLELTPTDLDNLIRDLLNIRRALRAGDISPEWS